MSRHIRFEGDAYTPEWCSEAKRRGILKATTIPEGIDLFMEPKTLDMLEHLGVFKKKEMEAFHTIRMESFIKSIEIEMSVLRDMIWEGILPGIMKQILMEKSSYDIVAEMDIPGMKGWHEHIYKLAAAKAELMEKTKQLTAMKEDLAAMELRERADTIVSKVVPAMEEIRRIADSVEIYVSAENLAYPKYRSLLSLSA